MCGIVGYIGKNQAKPVIINGLLRLEYRGYDSAGISTLENNSIKTVKIVGRIKNLLENENIENLNGTIGIGHTRWATHGKPSSINSHPHLDNSNTFSVVHNGIIENYLDLKNLLMNNGYNFLSETDTEVIPNLISYNLNKYLQENNLNINELNEQDMKKIIIRVINSSCKMLHGSYALEIITPLLPNSLIVVRKDSPLVIGKGIDECYISSDIPAILSFTKDFYLLDNHESAILSNDNSIDFFDGNLNIINKELKNITWDMASAEKDGYEDFMLKEIFEQPKAIRETIGSTLNESKVSIPNFNLDYDYLKNVNKIYFIACGTAMHAALAVTRIYENVLNIPVIIDAASEFRYSNPIVNENVLSIFISQSGETADTLAALNLAKSKGSKTIAVTNTIGSTISREADLSLYTHAGPEIAVASTKAYTSPITLLTILALYLAESLKLENSIIETLKQDLMSIPTKMETILNNVDLIKDFSNSVYKEKDMFFIGRLEDYAVSLEGSLKLKEISYIHSEAYSAGELKHGPIALIEQDVTVISIITNEETHLKTLSNMQEVVARGAKTFVITNQELGNANPDMLFSIPNITPYLSPLLSVIPLQLYAYYISKAKGLDVDKPRNLAKSVTVE